MHDSMTEADFSRKNLGVFGAQVLVAFMSTKLFEAKGALSKLDMSSNDIGEEQQLRIKQICEPKSICFRFDLRKQIIWLILCHRV